MVWQNFSTARNYESLSAVFGKCGPILLFNCETTSVNYFVRSLIRSYCFYLPSVFPMNPHVRLLVVWLVGPSRRGSRAVCHNFLQRQGSCTSMLLSKYYAMSMRTEDFKLGRRIKKRARCTINKDDNNNKNTAPSPVCSLFYCWCPYL